MKINHKWLFVIGLFFISGCITTEVNKPGSISDNQTRVVQASNSETPASLNKNITDMEIKHGVGDTIEILPGDPNAIKITTGKETTTVVRNEQIDANTGQSREDPTLKINAIMSNTKYIQYVGIALIVGGVALFLFFKTKGQFLLLSVLGGGMLILQSQLANPIWSWLLVAGIIILPFIWLYHLKTHRKGLSEIKEAIEQYKRDYPGESIHLLTYLSKHMDKKTKGLIKNLT